jgi:hypothetical protein
MPVGTGWSFDGAEDTSDVGEGARRVPDDVG